MGKFVNTEAGPIPQMVFSPLIYIWCLQFILNFELTSDGGHIDICCGRKCLLHQQQCHMCPEQPHLWFCDKNIKPLYNRLLCFTVKEIKSPPDVLVVFLTASEVWARKRPGFWRFQIRPHLLLKWPKGRLGGDFIFIIAWYKFCHQRIN